MTEFFVVLGCIAVNAVLAAIEIAFVSLPPAAIRRDTTLSERRKVRMLALRENPERSLSALQIGITLVGVLSGAVGGVGATETLGPLLEHRLGLGPAASEAVTLIAVAVPLTFFTVTLGELVPKSVALRNPLRIYLLFLPLLTWIDRLLSPLVSAFEWSTVTVVRILEAILPMEKLKSSPSSDPSEEIESLPELHRNYVLNLVNLDRKTLTDVMVPWEQVVSIELDATLEEIREKVSSSGHTRLPAVAEGKVVGLLHSKEFHLFQSEGHSDWQSILRAPIIVPRQARLLGVLRRLQQERKHMAIVGGLEGIVTLEDIVEEVFGEIYDEDDDRLVKRLLASRVRSRHRKRAGE